MAEGSRTFSESWHRIADQRISLRATVTIKKQIFRGETWYVLRDPFNNKFFRIRPEAYEFVVRLEPDRTVEQVWQECLERNPEGAPGQEDVIRLIGQLYFSNLLYHTLPADSAKLFERYSRTRQREMQTKLRSIMFLRIPLFDPEYILKKMTKAIKLLVSPVGAMIWFMIILMAAKVLIDNVDAAAAQAQGILAPQNLIFLYVGLIMVKTLHEFGHAIVCKRFGGEVHTMGVMLLVFMPLPYMDATSSWSFRSRWDRALVGAAGMIFELFIAALAVFVWAYTGAGIIHSIAYNMMFVASVSTVLFNANPLLRYDGYYILSDLLDIPNLHSRSLMHLRHIVEYNLFGCRESVSPARSRREAVWLSLFGVLSAIYKVVVFTVIIFFIADRFFIAGLIMAFICIISWGVVPVIRFAQYLASSPRLNRTRQRALAVSLGGLALVLFFLAVVPLPNRFRAPGILEAESYVKVINDAPGYVKTILVPSGADVAAGTPLIELSNKELELEIAAVNAQRRETLALQMQAVYSHTADLKPLHNRLVSIEKKLSNLEEQRQELVIRARKAGTWISPRLREMAGHWIIRGSEVGTIVNSGTFRFSAVVAQSEASHLFDGDIGNAEVRLFGQANSPLTVHNYQFIPFQHKRLPSAALGWNSGGDVPVAMKDESGLEAAEPFFQIYADLNRNESIAMLHGRSGRIRFNLPLEPLLFQWGRKFLQLIQKRYRV